MDEKEHQSIIADERATENRYVTEQNAREKANRSGAHSIAPNQFTDNIKFEVEFADTLFGRVALSGSEPVLNGNSQFYIGNVSYFPLDHDDFVVVRWNDEDIAGIFYQNPSCTHEFMDKVIARRHLARDIRGISDFEDTYIAGVEPGSAFKRASLKIPRAPQVIFPKPTLEQPTIVGNSAGVAPVEPVIIRSEHTQDEAPLDTTPEPLITSVPPTSKASAKTPSVRAPELMQRVLSNPKSSKLKSAIATLQPDQYELVTLPSSEDRFIQGHPGTGKTIIAVHRAAYLLNQTTKESSRIKKGLKLLLVGPTIEYTVHIGSVLKELIEDSDSYHSYPIPALLDSFAKFNKSSNKSLEPTQLEDWRDVDRNLARLVDHAYRLAAAAHPVGGITDQVLYEYFRKIPQNPPNIGLDKEWAEYIRELPDTIQELRNEGQIRRRGLLAYIGVRTMMLSNKFGQIGHIIVDEAQDLHPIEWEFLGRLGNSGGWTIIGDLNQRRNLYTFSTWDDVADLLAIEIETGAPIQYLENGYRSTFEIMNFANGLLPKSQRHTKSIQIGGVEPRKVRTHSERSLLGTTLSEALLQHDYVGTGTVAIIANDTTKLISLMRRNGWKDVPRKSSVLELENYTLHVFTPAKARGLEFDAVTVMEPADFPESLGSNGVLFTSLTRANRLLTVVYFKALPKGLKP